MPNPIISEGLREIGPKSALGELAQKTPLESLSNLNKSIDKFVSNWSEGNKLSPDLNRTIDSSVTEIPHGPIEKNSTDKFNPSKVEYNCLTDKPDQVFASQETNTQISETKETKETKKVNTYYCPLEGSNGHWEGQRGDSKWIPDRDYLPQKHNPENKIWGEVLDEQGTDGVNFNDGEPDFSDFSKGEVILDEQQTDRSMVFNEADTKLAEQRGCSPAEVYKWRKENGYTWHERSDGLTVQKVPSIVHGNVTHAGGHSANVRNQS